MNGKPFTTKVVETEDGKWAVTHEPSAYFGVDIVVEDKHVADAIAKMLREVYVRGRQDAQDQMRGALGL